MWTPQCASTAPPCPSPLFLDSRVPWHSSDLCPSVHTAPVLPAFPSPVLLHTEQAQLSLDTRLQAPWLGPLGSGVLLHGSHVCPAVDTVG